MEVEASVMVSSTYEKVALCLQNNYPIVEEENYVKLGEEPGLVSKVNNFRRKIRGGKVTCHPTLSVEIPSLQSTKEIDQRADLIMYFFLRDMLGRGYTMTWFHSLGIGLDVMWLPEKAFVTYSM